MGLVFQFIMRQWNKIKYIYLILFVFLFISTVSSNSSNENLQQVYAKNGVLNLQDWDFEKKPLARLDGEWVFFWNSDLTLEKNFIQVPSGWEKFGYPVHGNAIYSLDIILSPNVDFNQLGLLVPTISSSYRLFVNDCLHAELGKPSKESFSFEPLTKFYVVKIKCKPQGNKFNLKFEVANHYDQSSGLWDHIYFGNYEAAVKKYYNYRISNVALFLTIFVMGLYHILFYLFWKKEIASLYFGLFCFSIAIRTISIEDRWILETLPFLSFLVIHKLEILGFYLSGLFFLLFIHYSFKVNKFLFQFLFIIYALASAIVILFPFPIYIHTLLFIQAVTLLGLIYLFYFIIKNLTEDKIGIKSFAFGIIVFTFSIINDLLIGMGFLHSPYFASYGLLFLIITNASVLLKKFTKGYHLAEKLMLELELHKSELEEKVKQRTLEYEQANRQAIQEKKNLESLMLKIFPHEIAKELQEKGYSNPVYFKNVTVMFVDFVGFTDIVLKISPKQLLDELSVYYVQFDKIIEKFGLEKLKTIGDAYMCACGLPQPTLAKKNYETKQVIATILAAVEIMEFIQFLKSMKKSSSKVFWDARIGIHCGGLVAGVIGEKKFAYDVWGDTVNIASRMESYSEEGKINVSQEIYEKAKDFFEFEYRGEIEVKKRGRLPMFFLVGFKSELAKAENNMEPNQSFWDMYEEL
ncbi:MAG: adenylate/guanylate cyclase domain-containing protein [Leptospiraceae bacterium]|nr:adenylate/guanylate cyclase domain-containing protein [Leptospiraceae bacterium]